MNTEFIKTIFAILGVIITLLSVACIIGVTLNEKTNSTNTNKSTLTYSW